MFSRHQFLYSLVLCLLMQKVLSQESPEFAEEYIDEDLPESSIDEENLPPAKAINDTNHDDQKKTNFADDRFTKLFQPRNRNQNIPKPSPFLPKFAAKAKPTLPSFIKRTPPIIRVTPTTPSPAQNQRFNQRATSIAPQRTSTTRTPSRNAINGNNNNRRNQLNNNNNNRSVASTTSSPQSTTDSLARRRFGSSNRRFNANATIPATTSRPRRS